MAQPLTLFKQFSLLTQIYLSLKPAVCFARAWTSGKDTSCVTRPKLNAISFDLVTVHPASRLMLSTAQPRPATPANLLKTGSFGPTRQGCSGRVLHSSLSPFVSSAPGTRRRSTAVAHLWRRLSVILQKANNAALAARLKGSRPSQDGAL